jgi:K(+)-stimulated pyrophosphate-energized sodium pump
MVLDFQIILLFSGILGLLTVVFLLLTQKQIVKTEKRAIKIAALIRNGAFTFLKEEYSIIFLIASAITALLYIKVSTISSIAFAIGSILSLLVGFIGMFAATKSNIETAVNAKNHGERSAFLTAFRGGGVMGFAVASVGLLGLFLFLYIAFNRTDSFELILSSFGVGASLVAFFARIGGGIYTKSADVGADLVGKLEAGIPEDDPRNPAVIADNVGDCVGDTAGMGADIYESYLASMISTIVLAYYQFNGAFEYLILPLIISSIGLISSIISFLAVHLIKINAKNSLRFATIFSVATFILGSYFYINISEFPLEFLYVLIIGCISGIFVGGLTEYYTGGSPVRKLASISQSGAATNVIYGLSIGLESVFIPVVGLSLAIFLSYYFAGHFGVALSAVSMLATTGMTMTIDGYGPIADNAGGIAEMAGFGKPIREITDRLDSLGNTTAAVGKGFAIGSALLSALGVFAAYSMKANLTSLNLLDTTILVGLFIGATVPFLISALTMRSVGNAALKMVLEVRRQFQETKGLLEGKCEPDYERCISISTKAALTEMIFPGLITIGFPCLIRFLFGIKALGGFLVGATLTGVLLSLMMANGGGAWDNAKKYIESGFFGGKGSDAHKAAVTGDTIGDPFKDTSGPSLNILIKLMSMLSLLLIAF